jgi:hypothetical protein
MDTDTLAEKLDGKLRTWKPEIGRGLNFHSARQA